MGKRKRISQFCFSGKFLRHMRERKMSSFASLIKPCAYTWRANSKKNVFVTSSISPHSPHSQSTSPYLKPRMQKQTVRRLLYPFNFLLSLDILHAIAILISQHFSNLTMGWLKNLCLLSGLPSKLNITPWFRHLRHFKCVTKIYHSLALPR